MAFLLTFRKEITSVVNTKLISQETYEDLGTSLEGIDISELTISASPRVKVDCDENRFIYATNIDTDGFDIYGGPSGDDAPYNVRIAIQID